MRRRIKEEEAVLLWMDGSCQIWFRRRGDLSFRYLELDRARLILRLFAIKKLFWSPSDLDGMSISALSLAILPCFLLLLLSTNATKRFVWTWKLLSLYLSNTFFRFSGFLFGAELMKRFKVDEMIVEDERRTTFDRASHSELQPQSQSQFQMQVRKTCFALLCYHWIIYTLEKRHGTNLRCTISSWFFCLSSKLIRL